MRNRKRKNNTVCRTSLGRQVGKEIQLEAEFDAIGRPTYGDQSKTTILFRDVRFSGNPAADHIWVDEAAIVDRGMWGRSKVPRILMYLVSAENFVRSIRSRISLLSGLSRFPLKEKSS